MNGSTGGSLILFSMQGFYIYIYISDSLSLCGKPNQIGQSGLSLKTMSHAVQWASLDQPSMLLL